jgi:hypothetical protein
MRRPLHFVIPLLCLGPTPAASAVSFNDDIRPILADRCYSCHGPDSAARKADLRLDREEVAKAVLSEGVIPIVPGKPDQSAIIHRLTNVDPDEVMPPPKSNLTVTKDEIALIRQWIAEGAKWELHWAFIPPVQSVPPPARDHAWPRNGIDPFILEVLTDHELKPSPPADRAQLLRRVTLDLTGLPPTIAELDAFLRDQSENAYQRAVDRLLASPAYGERLALEWLDVARYGDTDGLFEDHARSIYPWRDWLVSAFNENLPYDQFITWQVAGDLLPNASNQQKIATGFLRNNPTSNEGGIIDEDYRIKYLIDRVNTTSTAFLGLTMECAQCHDHKFDPITQREYYEMAGFFNSLVGKGNTKGATAPTLKMLAVEKEKRLATIGTELAALDKTLKETPPALTADFEKWLAKIDKPVVWMKPKLVSSSLQERKTGDGRKRSHEQSKVRGRYVRIALPPGKSGFITISEVEIYSNGRNVARTGTAKQSSIGYNAPAAKAIDGNANGSFGSCCCTNEEKDAWWEVDLGAEMPIDYIIVSNRNDCCPERLDNVSVNVLNSAHKPTRESKIGDAPFRSTLTFNPKAPAPESSRQTYQITLELTATQGPVVALGIADSKAGVVESIRAHVIGGRERELKLTGNTKLKVGPGKEPAIVGLVKPTQFAAREQLKLTIIGDRAQVRVTSDPTALTRAKLPKERDKRLAHYRGTWPGFTEGRSKRDALNKEKGVIEKSAVITMVASDEGKMRTTHLLMRGEYDKPGEVVEPSPPGSIMNSSAELPKNRLGLARWITDPANPLTARVAVNRYWQMLFGAGLVITSEDFGTQGNRPSHQALLDYLAVDFVESGWDVKALLRKMVTSATYRQSSRQSKALAERDPRNRLLARAPRQRLQAEFIRDHALAVSGLLVNKRGGPGVNPYQPSVLFGRNAIGAAGASFKLGSGDDLYRRSLYTYWKRQIPAANMRILGADGRNSCRTRRERTNTPLQALVLLNDPQFVEAARVLAERTIKEGGSTTRERLAYAFRLSTSRRASKEELSILHAEFNDRIDEFKSNPGAAKSYLAGGGAHKANPALDPAELAAYAAVCSLILNLDESISKS